jgi:hypothetical protein
MQNACKLPYLSIGAFLKVSGELLGLLHGCCTDVTVCIRTRSRMIVIRPAAWSSLMRASSWERSPMSPVDVAARRRRSGADRIPYCKECSSNFEDAPSVICTLR